MSRSLRLLYQSWILPSLATVGVGSPSTARLWASSTLSIWRISSATLCAWTASVRNSGLCSLSHTNSGFDRP